MEKTKFSELELPSGIQKAIDEQGFEEATEIQAGSIPLIRQGKDVIGKSQTGTGKTIAFGIPAVEVIDPKLPKKNVQVLILCPTRELAMQAGDELKKLCKYSDSVSICEVYGGAPMQQQIMKLKRSNIVIGTPGRVMDHLRRKTMTISMMKMIVLDEADEMLSMGFREDIETILESAPEERQTVLFSATMPKAIIDITKTFQKNPEMISVNAKQVTLDNIKQFFYNAPVSRKKEVLNVVLQYHNPKRCIIFVNTKRMAEEVTEYLTSKGYSADGLHGDMRQPQRTKVMTEFKSGSLNYLVATDVAARGIDVNDVDLVLNYDVPQNSEYYVHRIGRTGRAGKEGKAITLCAGGRNLRELLQLVRLTKSNIEELELPDSSIIQERQNESNIDEILQNISQNNFHYESVIEKLKEQGFDEKTIALCALEMYFGAPKQIEELKVAPKKREQRRADRERGGNKIMINIGRNQNCAPNHIVGAITEWADISGKEIGKIDVYAKYTVVTVSAENISKVIEAVDNKKICGIQVSCTPYSDDGARNAQSHKRDNPKYRDKYNSHKSGERKTRGSTQGFRKSSKPAAEKLVPKGKKKFHA